MKQILNIDDIPWNLNTIIFSAKRHWGIYASAKKKWKDKIVILCKNQKLKKINKPCKIYITYVFTDKRRRDPDNLFSCLKFILDGLVEAKVIKDDSFKEIISIEMKQPKYADKKQTIIEFEW